MRRSDTDEPVNIRVVIALNASLSSAIDLMGYTPEAIIMPTTWTAADISFAAASYEAGQLPANATYVPLYDDNGVEVSVSGSAASRYISLGQNIRADLQGCRWLKVRSGLVAAAVNQLAERIFYLACRRY